MSGPGADAAGVMTEVPPSLLLAGFGATNRAVARALLSRGHAVTAFDDAPDTATVAAAEALGLELQIAPGDGRLDQLRHGDRNGCE